MKVVQVIPDFDLGGIQKAGCVLASELARAGHEALVVGRHGGPRYEDAPAERLHHRVSSAETDEAFAREILALEPDAIQIHAGAYEEDLVDALAAGGARVDAAPLLVSTPVFGRPPERPATLGRTRTAVVGTYILYRLRHWLGLSLDQAMRSGLVFTPVVSFQATDPPVSALDPPEVRAARRAELGIAADAFVVGRVGRAAPWKWHPSNRLFIDGFLETQPKGVWLSIGYPREDDVAALQQRWGDRFINLPQSSDYGLLTKAYASMDLQVFMSCAGECFAATICEPAGVGTPTVATANPVRDNGQSEQVVEGVTGHLVGTAEEALERVGELVADPDRLQRLKQSTHDYANSRWKPEQITRELVELLEAWLQPEPLETDRMRRMAEAAREFDDGYLPRLLGLYGDTAQSRMWWRFKLAAVRSWKLFQLGTRVKQWVD